VTYKTASCFLFLIEKSQSSWHHLLLLLLISCLLAMILSVPPQAIEHGIQKGHVDAHLLICKSCILLGMDYFCFTCSVSISWLV